MEHTFFKLRLISSYPTYGVTIPDRIALDFLDVFFTIKKSGNALILESGAVNNGQKDTLVK